MSIACLLLLSVGLVPCAHGSYSILPRVAAPGPCTAPNDTSAPTGLRGYRRFHANDSWIGRPLPCTREDKACFRYNLIFDHVSGVCEPVDVLTIFQCHIIVNRTELESGSGRNLAACRNYSDPCPGYRMAYDDRCYSTEVVRDVICGCEAKPMRHVLGGLVECRNSSATPINIQQPKEAGRCLLPDLRFPNRRREIFFSNSFSAIHGFVSDDINTIPFGGNNPTFECEASQAACFSQEKVSVSGYDGCHALLKRGPCPEEHVVALDIDAAKAGRAEATCVHVRGGCPPGHKRMLFDGQCHEDWEIKIVAPGDVFRNQFGQYVIIQHDSSVSFIPFLNAQKCVIAIGIIVPGAALPPLNPPCGSDDKGTCKLYEVESEIPLPEY